MDNKVPSQHIYSFLVETQDEPDTLASSNDIKS